MIRLRACAKVNLFLEITGKRPDGFHTLSTIFQTISLGDELTFSAADHLWLRCSEPSLPVDERNLVMRAALRLRDHLKEPRGALIHLKKIVPMGAGLGGGSADAAATLNGLLKLWKRTIPKTALHKLAVGLGADVPFFLKGGRCYGEGIGDELKDLKPLSKTWMVIVWPGFGVATKEAYSKVRLPFGNTHHVRDLGKTQISSLFNRFEEFVFPDHPELPKLKNELLEAGATSALMSGSGSSIFGLVPSRRIGENILKQMTRRYSHSWLAHTL